MLTMPRLHVWHQGVLTQIIHLLIDEAWLSRISNNGHIVECAIPCHQSFSDTPWDCTEGDNWVKSWQSQTNFALLCLCAGCQFSLPARARVVGYFLKQPYCGCRQEDECIKITQKWLSVAVEICTCPFAMPACTNMAPWKTCTSMLPSKVASYIKP